MADRRGSEGSLFSGERLVREGGVVKFEHIKFQSDKLIEYVGKVVNVISTGSSFRIDHITCYRGNKIVAIIYNDSYFKSLSKTI
jgi:hypothetical protein